MPTELSMEDWDAPTLAEKHAIQVCGSFPAAVVASSHGVVLLTIDADRGCIVLLTEEAAEIRLPTTEWTKGAYAPRESSRFWKRVALRETAASYRKLNQVIEAGIAARRAEFKPCRYCQQEFPPEHMTEDACHGCASTRLGIVY